MPEFREMPQVATETELEKSTHRRLIWLRVLAWSMWVMYIPIVAITYPWFGVYGAIVYMIAWFYVGWILSRTKCPQCGERILNRLGYANVFSSKCLHCGWPRKSEPEESQTYN